MLQLSTALTRAAVHTCAHRSPTDRWFAERFVLSIPVELLTSFVFPCCSLYLTLPARQDRLANVSVFLTQSRSSSLPRAAEQGRKAPCSPQPSATVGSLCESSRLLRSVLEHYTCPGPPVKGAGQTLSHFLRTRLPARSGRLEVAGPVFHLKYAYPSLERPAL
jgi:hypothetical protein